MNRNENVKKVLNGIKDLDKAELLLIKNRTLRMWIEKEKKINILNYWFYRYFTNSYTNFLLKMIKSK